MKSNSDRFYYWFKKICDDDRIRLSQDNPIVLNGRPLLWEVAYEILSFQEFSGRSIEDILYLSCDRNALLEALWPGDFPTREELNHYYLSTHDLLPWGHGLFRAAHNDEERHELWLRRVDVLQQLRQHGARSVLDYGSGCGHTVMAALAANFQDVGYHEYSIWHPYFAWRLKQAFAGRVQNVHISAVEEGTPDRKFDAVICSDVPEHVYDPIALLEDLTSLLDDGGLMVWVSFFGEGIKCHLHPHLMGKEEALLSSFGFTKEAELNAGYKGYTGLFRYTRPRRRSCPPVLSLPPNPVRRVNDNSYVFEQKAEEAPSEGTPKPKIAILYDMKGWAWWFRGHNVKKNIGPDYDIDVLSRDVPLNPNEYRYIVVFEARELKRLPYLPRHKTIIGCSAAAHIDKAMETYAEGGYAGFIVNNYAMYKKSRHLGNVFYCPNGVDENLFTPAAAPPESFTACWVGNSESVGNKGLDIVQAACRKAGVPLVYYDRKGQSTVHSQEDIRDLLYRRASVYINASEYEGTPNPALESLACGLPVISTRTGNMPELIKDGVNGFLVERSVDAIAEALSKLRALPVEELRQNARASILNGWRWKDQAKRYGKAFDHLLKQNTEDDSLFHGKDQVYLASADIMGQTLLNIESLMGEIRHPVHTYATVVGGLSGLNYISLLRPQSIVFFDTNAEMLPYCRFVIELIGICSDHREFISRIFARSVERFEAQFGRKLTHETQEQYLGMDVDGALLEETLSLLSPESRDVYQTYIVPHLTHSVLDGVRNCRRLLPCWPLMDRVPVGGGESTGVNKDGVRVPNTNTFFYGYGWLASRETFTSLQEMLRNADLSFRVIDLLNDPPTTWCVPGRSTALHASNINDWFPKPWEEALMGWMGVARKTMTDLFVISSHGGVTYLQKDPHCLAYEALLPFVGRDVIEVTHKPNWGFKEFAPRTIPVEQYLAQPSSADTILLHILLGNHKSMEEFEAVVSKSLAEGKQTIILEHDAASTDWNGALKIQSREDILQLVTDIADRNGCAVRLEASIPGLTDDKRNFFIVLS